MNLKNAVALVTGGGSGLGEATVREFASAGAKVAILDLPSSPGAKVAESLGANALFVEADVASADQVTDAIAKTVAKFASIQIAVNCAGIGRAMRTVTKDGPHSLDLFSKVIAVNLIGTFNVTRLAAAQMAKNQPGPDGERGVIINTASVAAFDGQIGQVAYSASKGGVVSMTLPIARELAQFGIRVLAIAPGLFLTPLLASLPQEAQDSLAAAIPFPRRLGDPSEFASLVMQMVDNPYLNGEVVRLDASLRMAPK